MAAMKKYKKLDEYIADLTGPSMDHITNLVDAIESEFPQLERTFAYGIPAYKMNGKTVVHLLAAKSHVGFYPGPEAVERFTDRLTEYKTTKGAIQFPYDKPLPLEMIKDIIMFKLGNN